MKNRSHIVGLYGIADATASGGDPVAIGAAMLLGGCRLIQLRCKSWSRSDVVIAARELAERCRHVDATFIVNDDPTLVDEVRADGVHLGQSDGEIATARTIVPKGALIGRSTGTLAEIEAAAAEADYVAFGPIWETPRLSKPKPAAGIALLHEARMRVPSPVPLVAIGGISAERVAEVRAAGADAWAVIGAIGLALDPVAATQALR